MDQWKSVIDAAIKLAEEAAKQTQTPWDDTVAAAARAVFERFFTGPQVWGGSADPVVVGATAEAAAEAEAVPAWLIPLVVEVVKWLMALRKK